MNKRIHQMKGPMDHFVANVTEQDDGYFRITFGYNCGSNTESCLFIDIHSARCYLAGKWCVKANEIALEGVIEILSTDQKIVKVAKQFHRGMILAHEFDSMMDRIINEDWEETFGRIEK